MLGHILAKVPVPGIPSSVDTSRPSLKTGSCKIVEKNSLNDIAADWNCHVNALDIASVVNAFACLLLLFLFHFCFHHPIFAWIALSGFRPTGE